MMYIIVPGLFFSLYILGWVYFFLYGKKLKEKEWVIQQIFISRTDTITGLFEVTKPYLNRHNEIFQEVLSLRKKEFHIIEVSQNPIALFEIESKIHHELNFIFQVCNTHPKLLKDKRFLYVRDIVLDKSSLLGKNISEYNRYLKIYNNMVRRKNLSGIGILLPFQKKEFLS